MVGIARRGSPVSRSVGSIDERSALRCSAISGPLELELPVLDLARVVVSSGLPSCPTMLRRHAFSSIALGVLVWAGCRVCPLCSSQHLDLDKVDALLNLPANADGQPRYVDEGDLRDALRTCVAGEHRIESRRANPMLTI